MQFTSSREALLNSRVREAIKDLCGGGGRYNQFNVRRPVFWQEHPVSWSSTLFRLTFVVKMAILRLSNSFFFLYAGNF